MLTMMTIRQFRKQSGGKRLKQIPPKLDIFKIYESKHIKHHYGYHVHQKHYLLLICLS